MSNGVYNKGVPENNELCPMPPYNATNFTDGGTIQQSLRSYARTQPQFPLPPGSNANAIHRNTANVIYFNTLNKQTAAVKASNVANYAKAPYPQFKTEGERLMYVQGKLSNAARVAVTGPIPAVQAGFRQTTMGVSPSTNYQIINNN